MKNHLQTIDYWKTRLENDSQRDWQYDKEDWIEDYWESRKHPHRNSIIAELQKLKPFTSLAEIGCNCGPNLARISEEFSNVKLKGLDANKESIERAKWLLPEVNFRHGSYLSLPWEDKSIDVILADATLMYSDPQEIYTAMSEIRRVCKKAVIIVDRFSRLDRNNGHIWSRNYPELLKQYSFKVINKIKITKEIWPGSKNWAKQGYIFVSVRQ